MGAATNYVLIPSLRLGIVILSNAEPIGAVEALGMEFSDLVQFGVVTRDWRTAYARLMEPMTAASGSLVGKAPPAHPAPALQPQDYTGTYFNDYFGDAVVARRDDALVLSLAPARMEYPLRHWDGNVFTFVPSGENANAGSVSKVTFTVRSPGQADQLVIEFFESSGWARFGRR